MATDDNERLDFSPTFKFEEEETTNVSKGLSFDDPLLPLLAPQQVDVEEAQKQSAANHFALGPLSPGSDVLFEDILSGFEPTRREQLMAEKRGELELAKQNILTNYVNNTPDPALPNFEGLSALQNAYFDPLVTDPESFYQKMYSRSVVSSAVLNPNNTAGPSNINVDEPGVFEAMTAAEQHITRNQVVLPIVSKYEKIWNEASTASAAGNYALNFLPFVSWFNTQDAIHYGNINSILPGSNRQEQYDNLRTMHPVVAAATLDKAADAISTISKLDAYLFTKGFIEYSGTEEALDNTFGVIDVAGVIPFAGATKAARGAISRLRSTAVAGGLSNNPYNIRLLQAQGRNADARLANVVKVMKDRALGTIPANQWDDVSAYVPSIFDIDTITSGLPGHLSTGQTTRMANALKENASSLIEGGITDPVRITRLTENAAQVGAQRAAQNLVHDYHNLNGKIMDVDTVFDATTNAHSARVIIGDESSLPFTSAQYADATAQKLYKLDQGTYTVDQLANGNYVIAMSKAIDETAPSVRAQMAIDIKPTKGSFLGKWAGLIQGKKTFLDTDTAADFDTAVVGTSGLQKFGEAINSDFIALKRKNKEGFKNLNDFLLYEATYVDPTGLKVSPGKWSDNQVTFEQEWLQRYKTIPSEDESTAYWKYRQLNDFDYLDRNILTYKRKVRLGMEHYDFLLPGTRAVDIEGRTLDEVPFGGEASGILISNGTTIKHRSTRGLDRTTLEQLLGSSEYKVIEVTTQGEQDILKNALAHGINSDATFRYVVVNRSNSKPLPFKQLEYNAGGHAVNPHGWGVRQPNIRTLDLGGGETRNFYRGDINWFTAATEAEAKQVSGILEQARLRLVAGATDADLDALFQASNFPSNGVSFRKSMADHGNINQSFLHSAQFSSTVDAHGLRGKIPNLHVGDGDGYVNGGIRFTQTRTRGLNGVENVGTADNPIFRTLNTPRVDPESVINQAVGTLMRNKYFDDIKLKAAERFLNEFADVIKFGDNRTLEQAQGNPFRALVDAEINYNVLNKTKAAAAANYRRATLEVMNFKNEAQTLLEHSIDHTINSIYRNISPQAARRVQSWELHKLDPAAFLRAIAYHSKLGLFNPAQLFVQAQTFVHIAGIEGLPRAASSGAAAFLLRTTGFKSDTATIALMANRAAAMGWKPAEFIEMYEGLRRSKWHNVGNEIAYRDNYTNPIERTGAVGKVLDAGSIFFTEGERFTRLTAWSAAYQGWKQANPGKGLTDAAIQQILRRADVLTVNMTAASNASWQKGLLSIPTQFFSYQFRLSEQLLGKQLTSAEKGQLLATYSVAYGLPLAATAPIGFAWPIHEEIRKYLLDQGIDTDSDLISRTLTHGILQVVAGIATGTDPALAERWGPGGITFWKDIIRGDKPVLEYLQGASGTTLSGFLESSVPLAGTLGRMLNGDDTLWPILKEDLLEFSRNISSVNATYKAFYGMGLINDYTTRKGNTLDDGVTSNEALISALFGAEPQRISDLFLRRELDTDIKNAQKEARQNAVQNIQLGYKAMADGKDEDAKAFFRNYSMWHKAGQFTPQQTVSIMKDSFKGHESLLERTYDTFQTDIERAQRFYNKPTEYKGNN